MAIKNKVELLKEYFSRREDVLMAFVFGSYAKGREISESDFDVAVYFKLKKGKENIDYETEYQIWSDIGSIVKKEVDLVSLNNAPASLISDILKTGVPLVIKDKKTYWEIYLKRSLETEDFLSFLEDFRRIKQKVKSLNPEEKERLIIRFDFLKDEFKELDRFKALSFGEYLKERDKRRLVERWAENILNASIDIAKIILASEKKTMPKTYEEALRDFGLLASLNEKESKKLSQFANLRNILAHEYLEILYKRIQRFIKDSPPLYQKIFNFLELYLT